jgi:hypothetical protein
MFLLHVEYSSVRDGIEPFGHHLVHVSACIPVSLVAVVGAKDDEE